MKVSICVVYHNREKNLTAWLAIWDQLPVKAGLSLTLIHNHDNPPPEVQEQCEKAGVTYCRRPDGRGMDIGALQDVARRRLDGFDYGYDFLLWFTDDCFPMVPDFAQKFLEPFAKDPLTGVSCLEISTQIRKHIRTTGFCMKRADVEKLVFQVDPVRTKNDCYVFEHRGPNSLYEQVMHAGRKAVQIAPIRLSPVWDSGGGGHGWVNRRQEFEKVWRKVTGSKVVIIAPAYERYPQIVSSMMLQTYHNWELHLVHNGPVPNDFPQTFDDERVIFSSEPRPLKNFGHPIREKLLMQIRMGKIKADYVVITNEDNYHAPFFLEKLVRALDENITAVGAYCSAMVHNYKGEPGQRVRMVDGHAIDGYGVINVKPEQGYIDVAAVMIRAKFAAEVGWPDYSHSSDWHYLNQIAQRFGGWNMFKCVPGCLLVHN